jgi:CheY-like chemotaxis protein
MAEDTKDNQMLVKAFLKKTPIQLDIAENGQIAVDKIKAGEYDLVFMDVQMPVMDGYTATREIRQWEKERGQTTEDWRRRTRDEEREMKDERRRTSFTRNPKVFPRPSSFVPPLSSLVPHI